MTKKDYELIAKTIKEAEWPDPGDYWDYSAKLIAAYTFAEALEETNFRFDRARFLKACGVEDS